jgi:hypothetical protein
VGRTTRLYGSYNKGGGTGHTVAKAGRGFMGQICRQRVSWRIDFPGLLLVVFSSLGHFPDKGALVCLDII